MKELKYTIRYLIRNQRFYIFIIGIFLINALHVFLTIQFYEKGHNSLESLYTADQLFILTNVDVNIFVIIIIAFPILSSMVFNDNYWLERSENITVYLHQRINYKKQLLIKLFLTVIVSIIIIFLGFMLNYLTLRAIYGSGNLSTSYGDLGFDLISHPENFIDILRMKNVTLYIFVISLHVSFLNSLVVGVGYIMSFFTKNRILIYFQTLIIIILMEVLLSFCGISKFSIIYQYQPTMPFQLVDALFIYIILILLIILGCTYVHKKRDLLL